MKKEPSKPFTPNAPEPTKADQMAAHYLAAVERRKKFWEEVIYYVKETGVSILLAGIIIGVVISLVDGMHWIQNQYDAKQAAIKQAQDDHDNIVNLQEAVSAIIETYNVTASKIHSILVTQSEQDARISALGHPVQYGTNLVSSNAAVIYLSTNGCIDYSNVPPPVLSTNWYDYYEPSNHWDFDKECMVSNQPPSYYWKIGDIYSNGQWVGQWNIGWRLDSEGNRSWFTNYIPITFTENFTN